MQMRFIPIILGLLMMPAPALAQFSDSFNFLKSVRDRDGNKATEIISKPGNVIIDTRDPQSGETALHIVARARDIGWMSFLLSRNAKTDMRDENGDTALMITAQIGFIEGAQMLLKRRANVDLSNASGETPLIRAVQNRDSTMVRALLLAGANPDKTDTGAGLSARDYATRDRRSTSILKIIDDTKSPKPAAAVSGPGR